MKITKRLLSVLMAVLTVLSLVASLSVVAAEDDNPLNEVEGWSGKNSLLIMLESGYNLNEISAETFADLGCTEFFALGTLYDAVLVFDSEREGFDLNNIREKLLEYDCIWRVYRNYYAYDGHELWCHANIDQESVRIKLGENAQISCVDIGRAGGSDFVTYAIVFEVDPEVIDESNLSYDLFSEYGIVSFSPYKDQSSDYYFTNEIVEPSETHKYVGIISSEFLSIPSESWPNDGDEYRRYYDILELEDTPYRYSVALTKMLKAPGVVDLYIEWVPIDGNIFDEDWESSEKDVVEMTLSGGRETGHECYVNQTATLVGKRVGTTVVSVYACRCPKAEDTCTVTVYSPADVNGDDALDSLDAAQILKYDVGAIDGTDWASYEGDLSGDFNGDGEVDSLDAAQILKYDAGLQ